VGYKERTNAFLKEPEFDHNGDEDEQRNEQQNQSRDGFGKGQRLRVMSISSRSS